MEEIGRRTGTYFTDSETRNVFSDKDRDIYEQLFR